MKRPLSLPPWLRDLVAALQLPLLMLALVVAAVLLPFIWLWYRHLRPVGIRYKM